MNRFRVSCLALATAAIAAPHASQSATPAPVPHLYMDVATHSMPGMPALGGLGKMAMGMFGKGNVAYGMTRHAGMPGQFLDVALRTGVTPAPEASQAIPAGLHLGASLPLLPPVQERSKPDNDVDFHMSALPDGEASARILIYWGCGSEVGKGQPREIKMSYKNGKADISGSMPATRSAPIPAINANSEYALWPNPRTKKAVPDGASLVGEHQVKGPGVPDSMRFALEQAQDFMPKIELTSSGGNAAATTWQWKSLPYATGYFLNAMGQKGDAIVMWSSAAMAEPGSGLMDYLPDATVAKWVKDGVLLSPKTTTCTVPAGIFGDGMGITQMIAYGPDRHISWPAKPAKAPASWQPDWTVRVRTKSTAFAPTGLLKAAMNGNDGPSDDAGEDAEKPAKNTLKGQLKDVLKSGLFKR